MIIKNQSDILTSLIDYTSGVTNKVTDYSVGSVIRSIYDAVSIEEETLYIFMQQNIEEGIASGLLSAFNFSPKPAQKAYGDLTLEFFTAIANDLRISRGTRFSTGDVASTFYYETQEDYLVPRGSSSAVIKVYAVQSGEVGNVLAGEISHAESTIYNLSRIYNVNPFLTGAEEETYTQARDRFRLMLDSIGKGTKSALLYGTLSVDGIQLAKLEEFVGYVNVYAGDANGLLTLGQQQAILTTLDDYRSAGIKVNVYPIDRTAIDVTMTVDVRGTGYVTDEFKLAFERYIYNYINTLAINSDFIYNDFVRYVLDFDSTLIMDIDIATPTENYITRAEEVLRAGNINVTYVERG